MTLKSKTIGYVVALVMTSSLLNGCVALALAPTAISFVAEGLSVHTTGQTLTENLRDAILEDDADGVEVAALNHPGLPPRKPTPPLHVVEELDIDTPTASIGMF